MSITNKQQFRQGKNVEAYLDDLFRFKGWTILQTSAYEEQVLCLGDRRYFRNGRCLLIEYKSGIQTFYTGNVFFETVSVDKARKPGWVFTCKADFIFYAAPLNNKILIFRPRKLRQVIEELKTQFREVSTGHKQNDGYDTRGVIVPLDYAATRLAEKVIEV